MDKEKLLEKIKTLISRSKGWKNDADNRGDYNDWFFYDGQMQAYIEIEKLINNQ